MGKVGRWMVELERADFMREVIWELLLQSLEGLLGVGGVGRVFLCADLFVWVFIFYFE